MANGDSGPPPNPDGCLSIFSGWAIGSAGCGLCRLGLGRAAAAGAGCAAAVVRPNIFSLIVGRHRVDAGDDAAGVLALLEEAHAWAWRRLTSTILESTLMLLPSTVRLPYRARSRRPQFPAELPAGASVSGRRSRDASSRPSAVEHLDLALLVEARAQHVVDAVPQEATSFSALILKGTMATCLAVGVGTGRPKHQGHQQHETIRISFRGTPGGSCLSV